MYQVLQWNSSKVTKCYSIYSCKCREKQESTNTFTQIKHHEVLYSQSNYLETSFPKFSYIFIDMLEILNYGFPHMMAFKLKKNVYPWFASFYVLFLFEEKKNKTSSKLLLVSLYYQDFSCLFSPYITSP